MGVKDLLKDPMGVNGLLPGASCGRCSVARRRQEVRAVQKGVWRPRRGLEDARGGGPITEGESEANGSLGGRAKCERRGCREEVVRSSDIGIGGTTATDIIAREQWVKPGATYISLSRREMDPAGWAAFDKVVIDDWECNMAGKEFNDMLDAGQFSREQLHGEICDVVTGRVAGRESDDERILIHTIGMVSQDVAICHYVYEKAKQRNLGIVLPPTDG